MDHAQEAECCNIPARDGKAFRGLAKPLQQYLALNISCIQEYFSQTLSNTNIAAFMHVYPGEQQPPCAKYPFRNVISVCSDRLLHKQHFLCRLLPMHPSRFCTPKSHPETLYCPLTTQRPWSAQSLSFPRIACCVLAPAILT